MLAQTLIATLGLLGLQAIPALAQDVDESILAVPYGYARIETWRATGTNLLQTCSLIIHGVAGCDGWSRSFCSSNLAADIDVCANVEDADCWGELTAPICGDPEDGPTVTVDFSNNGQLRFENQAGQKFECKLSDSTMKGDVKSGDECELVEVFE